MWFTSREAYDDLRLWITLSRTKNQASHVVTKVFPEEMALFALDPGNACDLRKTLKHAKLFSLKDMKFLVRDPEVAEGSVKSPYGSHRLLGRMNPCRSVKSSEEPEELGIELAFFDNASGQFLEPQAHTEYRRSLMRLIKTPKAPKATRQYRGSEDPWNTP